MPEGDRKVSLRIQGLNPFKKRINAKNSVVVACLYASSGVLRAILQKKGETGRYRVVKRAREQMVGVKVFYRTI